MFTQKTTKSIIGCAVVLFIIIIIMRIKEGSGCGVELLSFPNVEVAAFICSSSSTSTTRYTSSFTNPAKTNSNFLLQSSSSLLIPSQIFYHHKTSRTRGGRGRAAVTTTTTTAAAAAAAGVPTKLMMNLENTTPSSSNIQQQRLLIPSQVFLSPSAATQVILDNNNNNSNTTESTNIASTAMAITKRSTRRRRKNNKKNKKQNNNKKKNNNTNQLITNNIIEMKTPTDWFNNSTKNKNMNNNNNQCMMIINNNATMIHNNNSSSSSSENEDDANDQNVVGTNNNNHNDLTQNITVSLPSKLNDNNNNNNNIVSSSSSSSWITTGNIPDLYWRAISIEHLRQHPKFVSLPDTVHQLNHLNDVSLFRQESWQWDALHLGRCTTSQAVVALGFLEPLTATVLKIPKSWQKRSAKSTFIRLKHEPLRTLDEMNHILCNNNGTSATVATTTFTTNDSGTSVDMDKNKVSSSSTLNNKTRKKTAIKNELWTLNRNNDKHPFIATYNHIPSFEDMNRRKKEAKRIFSTTNRNPNNEQQQQQQRIPVAMMWGNTQESTAVLTALNYFAQYDPDFVIRETGMCGAGLQINQTSSTSLLIGATPDGILCHGDGRIEALEVKNHCPFYSTIPIYQSKKHRSHSKSKHQQPRKRFFLGDRSFDQNHNNNTNTNNGVFSHYVPQLMMEMLCLGPDCQSAVMIRQTATAGALLLRMYRNNEWIDEMIYWLQQFYSKYVEQNKLPPSNFFYDNPNNREEQSRYRRFVNKTLELCNTVQIIAHIPNDQIQRVQDDTPLFLD